MTILDALEKKFGKFTVPHLLPILLAGQLLVFLGMNAGALGPEMLLLNGGLVRLGEYWRLFTFMIVPMAGNMLFFFLSVYVTYMIGSSLEREWGEFRFGLYFGVSWFITIVTALFFPFGVFTNAYIMGSLILAYARLFPNVEFLLFFVVPLKVKYIGYALWAQFALSFIQGNVAGKMAVVAASVPFFLFFGGEILGLAKQKKRSADYHKKVKVASGTPFHQCASCLRNDLSDPSLNFRYENGTCICDVCVKERKPA
jgi:hypothetical protein